MVDTCYSCRALILTMLYHVIIATIVCRCIVGSAVQHLHSKSVRGSVNRTLPPQDNRNCRMVQVFKRTQGDNEHIADFVAELRRLAKTCNFGNYLDTAIRDQFVCGPSGTRNANKGY